MRRDACWARLAPPPPRLSHPMFHRHPEIPRPCLIPALLPSPCGRPACAVAPEPLQTAGCCPSNPYMLPLQSYKVRLVLQVLSRACGWKFWRAPFCDPSSLLACLDGFTLPSYHQGSFFLVTLVLFLFRNMHVLYGSYLPLKNYYSIQGGGPYPLLK